jgi:hypothetical protein
MADGPVDDFPVLDDSVLQDLKDEVGEVVAQEFIEDYLLSLFGKAIRILQSVDRGDPVDKLDAVLSLRTSSEMAGAARLAAYCRELEAAVKTGKSPDAAAVKTKLPAQIRNVIREASRRGHLPPQHLKPGPEHPGR